MQNTKKNAGILLPTEYNFRGTPIRTVVIDDTPYFVATDVCCCLSISNPTVAIRVIDDDERSQYYLGRQGHTWIVNESGLYHLIFQSRKPEAKTFRKWVTSEVLPELRKTGSYATLPDVSFQIVNDRRVYPFHEVAMKLGYTSSGSLYDRKYRYPEQFIKIGCKLYASEEMCRSLSISRKAYQARKSLNQLKPLLSITVSQLTLPM